MLLFTNFTKLISTLYSFGFKPKNVETSLLDFQELKKQLVKRGKGFVTWSRGNIQEKLEPYIEPKSCENPLLDETDPKEGNTTCNETLTPSFNM